jgi:hypothetical protein
LYKFFEEKLKEIEIVVKDTLLFDENDVYCYFEGLNWQKLNEFVNFC